MAKGLDPRIADWRWRVNNLYKIADKDGNLVSFKENWIQKRISDNRSRRKMVLKYRQGGVTTGELIKQLDFVSFSENKTACVMADEKENMERIFSKVRLAHKNMPGGLRPDLGKGGGSAFELRFPDLNSKIYCSLEGRGDTIHWLHISEAAFADPKRVRATLEAVPVNGIVTFESTPNGMGNSFYKRWVTPSQSLAKLFFPWYLHPEYKMDGTRITEYTEEEQIFIAYVKSKYGADVTADQIAFRRAKQEDQQELFIQEYPENDISCFIASGGTAVDQVIVKQLLDNAAKPIYDDGTLKVWKEYDAREQYVLGADTAEGRGGDNSVATVMCVRTREQVAEYASNRSRPRAFAKVCYDLAHRYNKPGRYMPLMVVERNNHGHAVLLELEEHLHYENLYAYKDGANGTEKVVGWKTDLVTRPIMVDAFIDGVENGTMKLNSVEALGECLTLIDNDGKIEAVEGENDDRIIAGALALQGCIQVAGDLSLYENLHDTILV